MDKDHMHFLMQLAKLECYEIGNTDQKYHNPRDISFVSTYRKNSFGVGSFWINQYFSSTVGRHGDEDTIEIM